MNNMKRELYAMEQANRNLHAENVDLNLKLDATITLKGDYQDVLADRGSFEDYVHNNREMQQELDKFDSLPQLFKDQYKDLHTRVYNVTVVVHL